MEYSLVDYRCKCNKLLFKGCLLFSTIEVKCKRCGKINLFQQKNKDKKDVSFSFFIDSFGKVKDGCCATSFIEKRESFMGKEVKELISELEDKEEINFFTTSNNHDKIKDNDNYYLFGRINSNKISLN